MPCEYISFTNNEEGDPCQFHVSENEIISVGTKKWCIYHCPIECDGIKTEKWEQRKSFEGMLSNYIKNLPKDSTEIVDLSGVIFPDYFTFSNKLRYSEFILNDTTFHDLVWFVFTEQDLGDISATGATFLGFQTMFEGHYKYICFYDSNFLSSRTIILAETEFVFFEDCEFSDVKFTGSVFKDSGLARREVVFDNICFNEQVDFYNVVFSKNIRFSGVKFNGRANFGADINLENKQFRCVIFDSCVFRKSLTFNNRIFGDTTIFKEVDFYEAPAFHNSIIHQDTSFFNCKFLDVKSLNSRRSYETLRLAMEKQNARDEQSMFYALEQQSLRNRPETELWVKFFSLTYEQFSNYGSSALRPLGFMIFTFLCFWLTYSRFVVNSRWPDRLEITFEFAMEQVFRPFNVWGVSGIKQITSIFGNDFTLIQFIASLESLIMTILLALFILAIRWKFRR